MGKSSNSRQKLAFRAARRRVLAPHLRSELLTTLKPLYETAGLIPPTSEQSKQADDFERTGIWSGVQVAQSFAKSDKGRVLNSVHRVKGDVSMDVDGIEGGEGLVGLGDKVKAAEVRRRWREENKMRDVVMRDVRRGRGSGIVKRKGKKKRHPKNKPSVKF